MQIILIYKLYNSYFKQTFLYKTKILDVQYVKLQILWPYISE